MDPQMSPYSIPSIGNATPLHTLDEDQQIVANTFQQQSHMTPNTLSGMHGGMTPYGMGSLSGSMGMPSLMASKQMPHTYAPSFSTPQNLIQPPTPVSLELSIANLIILN